MLKIIYAFSIILLLAVSGFLIYDIIPKSAINLEPKNNNFIDNFSSYTDFMQFYPNMRFASLPITYSEEGCKEEEKSRISSAFLILEKESNLNFKESPEGNIIIFCGKEPPKPISSETFVAGEGGPRLIINTGRYSIITQSEIYIFKSIDCNQPIVELHEILHALGFEHSNYKISIMYNYTSCSQSLTTDIIEKIKFLYSQESLPDLLFGNVKAQLSGRYLDFKSEIKNQGLKETESFNLSLYSNGNKIKDFNIKNIKPGEMRILDVKNLKVSDILGSEAKEITIKIDEQNKIKEIDKNNNVISLSV